MSARERPWPPLIVAARIPFWIKVRDQVLTVLMWVLFLFLLIVEVDVVRMAHTIRVDIDWLGMREDLSPFLVLIVVLTSLLFVASLATLRRRRRALLLPEPPPMTLAEHAERGHISVETLSHARGFRIVVIHVDADRQLRFEPR
jgi:poly-beta-1,6-N-acetyl-D-glucosamine biosynthesis protein PgaD